MIINERDSLIVTDNFLTNLPISRLSSIPTDAYGIGSDDLFLISRPCEPSAMTDTGYMSYNTSLGMLSAWMYDTFGLQALLTEVGGIHQSVDMLSPFYDMLCMISCACPSAVVDISDGEDRFNPYVISSIQTSAGTIISDLGGYRFADAMQDIFDWKVFPQISAQNGWFGNANISNLTVNGRPYQQLSVMKQSDYNSLTPKSSDCFYFTYI